MTIDTRKPGQEEVVLRPLQESRTEAEDIANGWATATRRALLYLKALGVPPRDCLRLAEEALSCAEREAGSPAVQSAMISLRSLVYPGGVPANGLSSGWTSGGVLHSRTPMAVPPVNRGVMIPASIDRRPWLTLLLRFARRFRSSSRKARRRREAEARQDLQIGPVMPRVKEEKRRAP